MKSFQTQDVFNLHKILYHFETFKSYHIEIFKTEHKKILYASNHKEWHENYIKNQLWATDLMVKMAMEHKNTNGVFLMEWPFSLFKMRENLRIQHGFSKLKIEDNFLKIINVCVFDNNTETIGHVFDILDIVLEGASISEVNFKTRNVTIS